MSRMKHGFTIALSLLAAALVGGCATSSSSEDADGGSSAATRSVEISNTDACAMRLHDICGGLLLFYDRYGRLPDAIEELRDIPGVEGGISLRCPVSDQPYVYVHAGIFLPERNSRLVLYDPAPSHSRMRWAVTVEESSIGGPLVTKMIALPESFFLLHPPMSR